MHQELLPVEAAGCAGPVVDVAFVASREDHATIRSSVMTVDSGVALVVAFEPAAY